MTILAFWRGSTCGPFDIEGGIDKLRQAGVENVMNGIKSGDTREKLIKLYTEQLNLIEEKLHELGVSTEENIKKVAEDLDITFDYLRLLWAINIMSLLILKAIKEDNDYGFIEVDY